jgi:hypothetical protein
MSPYIIKHAKSDFSSQSLRSVFAGQDLVISTMSGGDYELQIKLIDALIAADVRHFIPHEFGQDTMNERIQARSQKSAGRAKVLEYLQARSSKAKPDLDWIGIATGYTLDTNLISGDLGFDMEWHSATIHGIGTELFAVSSLERVAQVVLRVVQQWDQIKSHYIYAAGVVTSAHEILRCAENATGREWTAGNYDIEDSVKEGTVRIQRGFPDAGMALLERSVLYDKELDASAPFQSASSNRLLRLQTESVQDIVDKAYHDLQHYGRPGCACSC